MTPHPSAYGCHLLPQEKANGVRTQRIKVLFAQTKKQKDTNRCPFVLAEKERFEAVNRPPPSHSRRALLEDSLPSTPCFRRFRFKKTILNRFFLLPLPNNRRWESSNPSSKTKRTPIGVLLFWRRRRDLNSRAGYIRPTPLAGAPLRPT